jgi:hypothetical protein
MLKRIEQTIENLTDDYIIELLNDLNVENDKLSNVCYNCVDSLINYQLFTDVNLFNVDEKICDILYEEMFNRVYKILYSKYPDRFKSDILNLYDIESFDALIDRYNQKIIKLKSEL